MKSSCTAEVLRCSGPNAFQVFIYQFFQLSALISGSNQRTPKYLTGPDCITGHLLVISFEKMNWN